MAEPTAGAGTVYVVDDDPSMRSALQRLFRTSGLAVSTFDSPAAFLAQDGDASPCCAVLDLQMPGLDGLALQARLTEAGRTLPIVFITAHGDVSSSVRAMKSGAVDFIEKPFDNADLLAAVGRALEASRDAARTQQERAAIERRLATLTGREREVFVLVVQGLMNKVVGARLGVAEKTVKVHRARVMEKMEAGSLAELARMAERLGLA